MRALQMKGYQHDPGLVDVPVPNPGPGEALVRVGGAGVCHSDLHVLYEFPEELFPWSLPFTLGHETAGWVESYGPGASGPPAGTPVALFGPWGCGLCPACLEGAENACFQYGVGGNPVPGLGLDGGMAEFVTVPAQYLIPLPDGLEPAVAAPLTDAALTPYHAIRRAGSALVPGQVAVVLGAGGLGHMAVQILRATTGMVVVAVDAKPAARDLALAVGADAALAPEGAAEAVRELTGGRGARAIFDTVGSPATLGTGVAMLAPEGHLGIIGLAGGSVTVAMNAFPYGATVVVTYWGTRRDLAEVLRLAAVGQISGRITTFPLSRGLDAYAAMKAGTIEGRAVVVPD